MKTWISLAAILLVSGCSNSIEQITSNPVSKMDNGLLIAPAPKRDLPLAPKKRQVQALGSNLTDASVSVLVDSLLHASDVSSLAITHKKAQAARELDKLTAPDIMDDAPVCVVKVKGNIVWPFPGEKQTGKELLLILSDENGSILQADMPK